MAAQVRANELEDELKAEKAAAAYRVAAIATGTRILPSDGAIAEVAKKAVKESNGKLALVFDVNGQVIGACETGKVTLAEKVGGFLAG
jgi:hypothetical protein